MKTTALRQLLAGAILLSASGALSTEAHAAIATARSLDNADSDAIWAMTKPRQAYALGSEITVSLQTNELLQLDCSSGSDDAFACTLVRGDTLIHMLFFSPEGDLISRGGSSVTQHRGAVRQAGELPFLAVAAWVLAGEELQIQFCIQTNEDFVVALHGSSRAKVIGEKTNGSTGQPLMLSLPGGGGARICTKWDTYPDGREFVGVGVIPDVEVHPTPAKVAAGRDVVLARAIEALKKALL